MPDVMFLNNEDGKFLEVFINSESGLYPKDRLIGKFYKDIFPNKVASFFYKSIKKAIKDKSLNIIEYELKSSKKIRYYEARIMPIGLSIDDKETVIVIVRDITKAKKTKDRLKFIAMHDSLTKLPNRFLFQKELKFAIKRAKKENLLGALFFLDIDRFKEINDNLGHDIGDKLLIKCTRRLKKILCKESTLSRFGGDEFVILVENILSRQEAIYIADKIMNTFIKPFKIGKYILDVTTSMGISIFPEDSSQITQLIKQTDMAMYQAKTLGRNNYQFFTKELADKAYRKFMLEASLKNAIDNSEFSLVYQPQVRLSDKKIIGVEALLRWENRNLGVIPPNIFIPIAEICGFIEPISNWVIRMVCKQIKIWDSKQYFPIRVAINLSRREIGKIDIFDRITTIINEYNIDFRRIEFEVTESALLENVSHAFKNIKKFRSVGFMVSIDDFGTGYSSLSNLKDMLFDKLKIDRSFTRYILIDKGDEAIVKATIALAKSLNLKVIAEGVETDEQLEFLANYGCDEMQGYLYSQPLTAELFEKQFLQNIDFTKFSRRNIIS
jgi:diguanylate cyclase (GGDEF)-like protein